MTATSQAGGPGSARHAADPSLGELVAEASTSFTTLLRGEFELAKSEITTSAKKGLISVGSFVVAGAVLLFSLTFLFIGVALVLARYLMPAWAAFLVVFGFLLLLTGVLALIGVRFVKKVKAPQRTIATTKETVSYLKDHGPRTAD